MGTRQCRKNLVCTAILLLSFSAVGVLAAFLGVAPAFGTTGDDGMARTALMSESYYEDEDYDYWDYEDENYYDIANATISPIPTQYYNGSTEDSVEPTLNVTFNGVSLEEGTDYFVEYSNNDSPGIATATINGEGDYYGSKRVTFRIVGDISKYLAFCYDTVSSKKPIGSSYQRFWDIDDEYYSYYYIKTKKYTGQALRPNPKVVLVPSDEDLFVNGIRLNAKSDYTLSYSNNTNVGTATITITGKGNYTGSIKTTFKIKKPLSNARMSKVQTKYYTGNAIKPKPKVSYGGNTLKLGRDYTLSYSKNKAAGTAKVTAIGKGKYFGSISRSFKIIKRKISKATISKIPRQVLKNNGKATPKPLVKLGKKKLKLGKDYRLSYKRNNEAGTGTVIVKGKGRFTGKKTRSFKIVGNLKYADIADIELQFTTGKQIKPTPKVKFRNKTLKRGKDYNLSYRSNIDEGTATLIVEGKGKKYVGKTSATFEIIQSGSGDTMSYDEFTRIRSGMTYSEVCTIVGGEGMLTSSYDGYQTYYRSYQWDGDNEYSSASVSFEDGEVSSKHQYGL